MSVDALTALERASCYELAEVIYKDNVKATLHNSFGSQVLLTELNELQDALEEALDNLIGDDTATQKVRDIVEEWDPIANFSGKIENGSIGCVTGVTIDFDAIKETIKRRFCKYIPVMHLKKASAMVQDQPPGRSSNVIGISRA
jgi:hypothetical protein